MSTNEILYYPQLEGDNMLRKKEKSLARTFQFY